MAHDKQINGGPPPKREQAWTDGYDLAAEFHVACRTGPRPASLDALIANRSKDRQWPGPPRLDPWGVPYVIRLLPGGAEPDDEIVSSGPDRVLGTDDDLRARIWGEKSRR